MVWPVQAAVARARRDRQGTRRQSDGRKVNIDQNPESPQKYGVRGIPTLILFKDGKPVATKVGSLPKGQLVEWLNSVVA